MEKPGSFWRSRRSCPSLPMPLCDLCGLCVCVVICCFAAEGWGSQRMGERLPEQEMRRAHVRTQEEGLGFVAFFYDMVGFGDSKPFGHTFRDARMDRLGMSLTGLQLWNSLRALDFLRSLPDVDPERIGCTGASGGGTQTFLLAAVDERVHVPAPVCMVSASFQGGCECENCPSLRIDTDNVEIA